MEEINIRIMKPTIEMLQKIHAICNGSEKVTSVTPSATLEGLTKPVKTKGKKKAPEKTVSKDEDEDFGTEEMEEEDLDDTDDEESEESDEDEEDALDFDDVRQAINTLGNKDPDAMKAIYAGFNIRSSKELKGLPKKWEPIYRKVKAKLAAKGKK